MSLVALERNIVVKHLAVDRVPHSGPPTVLLDKGRFNCSSGRPMWGVQIVYVFAHAEFLNLSKGMKVRKDEVLFAERSEFHRLKAPRAAEHLS
ncbi:hypothetical protein NQ318_003499 [Aromia moschata]|uniref:Uncharacterized protein n=1 Tax=Aromia moschata TaxID=1265417 RepID=A0AAV8YV78_9CUCU|nr:hypothetical protein NQ318_003499 [Aromia moschata]